MVKFPKTLALAFAACTAFADPPCPPDATSNAPINDPNLKTISTATKATAELPNAPGFSDAKIVSMKPQADDKGVVQKKPWIRIEFKIQGETEEQKPHVVSMIALDYQAINDPKNPNHAQAVADQTTAFNTYVQVINECPPKATCGPTTLAQYTTLLQQSQSMTMGAKTQLLSMIGNQLDVLYNNNAGTSVTSMERVFQALRNFKTDAGECRDIPTFLAYTANALGLQDAGTLGGDWNNGYSTGSHVITEFRDPKTGNFFYVNYDQVYSTDSKYLSEASQIIAQHLNSTSSGTFVETGTAQGTKTLIVETKTSREMAIEDTVDRGSDLNRPMLDFSIGDLESEASFRKVLARSNKNDIGIYIMGAADRHDLPIEFGQAGVRGDFDKTKQLTDKTELEFKGTARVGFEDVHDKSPTGDSRNEMGINGKGKFETDYSWKGDKNQGHVGVQAEIDATLFSTNIRGQNGFSPYDVIKVVAVDDPTKNVEVHGFSSFFAYAASNWQTAITVHHQDDAAGVKLTKELDHGNAALTTDTTVHDFAGQAIGVNNETSATFKLRRAGDLTFGNQLGYVHNSGPSAFYTYPVTGSVDFEYRKSLGNFELDADAQYHYNNHNTFTLMQQDYNDPAVWGVHPPKWTFGVTLRRKPADNSQKPEFLRYFHVLRRPTRN